MVLNWLMFFNVKKSVANLVFIPERLGVWSLVAAACAEYPAAALIAGVT